ncbi:MAG TPA: primosomal protein N' [Thermoanaerobaculia bacterium]|nr:primosomal protein N' [Thermoanaerobaculia bacterium]
MPKAPTLYAEVAVPLGVFDTFTYSIPDELRRGVRVGCRVEVPLGTKLTTGFVTGFIGETSVPSKKLRPIKSLLDEDEPALLPEILELCKWAAGYYLAPLGEMIRTALPANMASRGKRILRFTGNQELVDIALAEGRINDEDVALLDGLKGRDLLVRTVTESIPLAHRSISRLRDAGLISVVESFRDNDGVRQDRFAVLRKEEAGLPPRQQEVVDLLIARGGELSIRALEAQKVSDSTIRTLLKKDVLAIERRPRRHTLDAFFASLDAVDIGTVVYSAEQLAAIEAVRKHMGTFTPFLLEGVTGSGKTEIYIELMRDVVSRGEQAILLVPEISLTPVFAARLKERFGDRIAILHSNLSAGERYDQWWRARRGLVDVAIGPRSALFIPFERLGLLVVDEEGDSAYKQEETPRYNARDVAVVRARIRGIPIVLGSATPSLESRENVSLGKYQMLRLTKRVEARPLPTAEVIDIRGERGEKEDRGLIIFSSKLQQEMAQVFSRGEQAIVLMNRRGYAPFLLCRECENDFRCRDCSVTMTVHRRSGLLICHYCGQRKPIPVRCPLCDGEVLQPIGFGTEKVEERFRRIFPEVAVDVLDRDSTRKKGELVRILRRFRTGETQALIGTQMLSKGHHFPKVTLTGVINADAILGYPDFRSSEKTFYLLTQVAGRAGRGELPGRVLIQSAFPSHHAIQHALRHDYEAFFEDEIEFRRTFHYPPVTGMIAILFRGEEIRAVEKASSAVGQTLELSTRALRGVRIQGPAPSPLARIKGVFRYQILIRGRERVKLRDAVARAVFGSKHPGVEVIVDVDPINIL